MLKIARERLDNLGLSTIELREMDAESLDFPPHSFDAILCRFGLMFLPQLDESLARIRQLLLPGGKLATAVWDVPSKVPMLSLPMRVARQQLQLPPPLAGMPNPFNLADVATAEQRFVQAGYENVHSEHITLTWAFASADEFVNMTRDLAAPVVALLATHSPDRQTAVWNGIAEAAKQYAQEDGRLLIPSEAICIVGTRGK